MAATQPEAAMARVWLRREDNEAQALCSCDRSDGMTPNPGEPTLGAMVLRVALLLAGMTASEIGRAAPGDRLDRSKLTLTFTEEFEGPVSFWNPKTNMGRWKTCYWFGWQPPGQGCIHYSSRTIDGGGSLEVMSDPSYNGANPFRVQDGRLNLIADHNPRPNDPKNHGKTYTAGLITTEKSFAQLYGYFEMKARLPAGKGLWPAFWMLPEINDKEPRELDVMEHLGGDPSVIYCSAHWGVKDKTAPDSIKATTIKVDIGTVLKDRSYGLLWTREKLIWYVDDLEVAQMPNKDLDTPMYLLVSMGVGGTWGGYPDDKTQFPASMVIDHIRAYQIVP